MKDSREFDLQEKLTYGKGLTTSEWDEIISLRTNRFIEEGKTPKEWNLNSRQVTKK